MPETPILPLLIDGVPYNDPSAKIATHYSAHHGGEPYVQYKSATPEATRAAAASSFAAFKRWSQTLATHRRTIIQKLAALIRENAAQLVQLQVEETNCAQMWAERNIEFSTSYLEELAGLITGVLSGHIPVCETPGQMALVYKQPIGPIFSIPPWNAALFLPLKAISAPVALGCTVLLKASEQSPKTHHYLVSLFSQAGVPAGVINVIQARREDAAAVCEAAISHPAIRKIEFIGSAGVGRHIGALAGKYLKPAMIELGGKNATIVLDDADLELAAKSAVMGALTHHGQICFAVDVVIVQRSVYPSLLEGLKAVAAAFPTHSAIGSAGPARTLRLVQEAVSKGAEILYGKPELLQDYALQPIILGSVNPQSEIFDEEAFGPTIQIKVVDSEQEAIDFANSSQYGLGSAVFSRNIERALTVARQLEAGQTNINWPYGAGAVEATVPVNVVKGSGWGTLNGHYGLEEFLVLKTITITNPVEHERILSSAQGA